MQKIKVEQVSGFPEWLPGERMLEQELINTIRGQYELFGFAPIETSAVEKMDVLTSKGGIQRQIYKLARPSEDGADASTDLGLHFDLTVPLARYVAVHAEQLTFPFRRYQIQKVWRGERAQRGRFREFYQCDIDTIGSGNLDLLHDAEVPCVINSVFTEIGIPEFTVRVSHRGVLGSVLSAFNVERDCQPQVLKAVDKSVRDGIESTQTELAEIGLSAPCVDAIVALCSTQELSTAKTALVQAKVPLNEFEEFENIVESSIALGMPEERLVPDFRIARGLDYYTGTVFETFLTGREDWGSVCSGGRYDDLASHFSARQFPGVGVSIGLTRLFSLMLQAKILSVNSQTPATCVVTMQDRAGFQADYLAIADRLRRVGVRTEMSMQSASLGEQLRSAAARGITYAVIAGESEFQSGTLVVKNLATRDQTEIPAQTLEDYIGKEE